MKLELLYATLVLTGLRPPPPPMLCMLMNLGKFKEIVMVVIVDILSFLSIYILSFEVCDMKYSVFKSHRDNNNKKRGRRWFSLIFFFNTIDLTENLSITTIETF